MPWSISNVAPSGVVTDDLARGAAVAVALVGRLAASVGAVGGTLRRGVAGREARGHAGVTLVVRDVGGQDLPERLLRLRDDDAVLGALRPGDRRHDRGQVELEVLAVARLGLVGPGLEPHALLLGVRLDERDRLGRAAGEAQVLEGHLVDREDRAGRAELGAHVADRGAVGQGDGRDALAVELDELADHSVLAQHLGDREDDVGGGGAGRDGAGELEADDARDEHRDGLAEHGRLGLDAADAPAEHPEAVDHRGVAVGADTGVGVGDAVSDHDGAGEVLDVDLVHDAGARRDHLEVVERGLAPAQELVALLVALVLDGDVALERVGAAEHVDDHRVVDDQLGRGERVDLGRVAAELGDRLAHGGEVDDTGHTGEVLHDHAGRGELDLGVGVGVLVPPADSPDVVGGDVRTVLGAQQVLEEHLEAVGQRLAPLDRREPVDLVGLLTHLERAVGVEAVRAGHRGSLQVVRHRAIPVIYLDVKISNHTGSVGSSLCRAVPTREIVSSEVGRAVAQAGTNRATHSTWWVIGKASSARRPSSR